MARTRTARRVFGLAGLLLAAMLFVVGAAFAQDGESDVPPQTTDVEIPTPQPSEYLIEVQSVDVQVQRTPSGQGVVGVAIEAVIGNG